MNGFGAVVGVAALVATVGTGGGLAPVGARQPGPRAQIAGCDVQFFAPAADVEGACLDGDVIIVAADRAHAVALNTLILDVTDVTPIGPVRDRTGRDGPFDPS